MQPLKIAIQKKGRLSDATLDLLKACGLSITKTSRRLKTSVRNFPAEILFLRDDDIPKYVEQGVADVGILGQNELWEQEQNTREICPLGFARCKMSLAIPREVAYSSILDLEGKTVATSYPRILSNYCENAGVRVDIETIGGSVEIATGVGLADAIFDIVSTGSTLLMNGLKEVEVVCKSEATLISNQRLSSEKEKLLEKLLFRIRATQAASTNKYIMLNAPNDQLSDIEGLLPGMKSPTVMPLKERGWSSFQSVIKEDNFWDVIDRLKEVGAEGILVMPIEKMVF